MGMYKYVQKLWKSPKENLGDVWKSRLVKWRKENSVVRIENPTRIDRARNNGYKSKQGYVVVRSRVSRGGRKVPKPKGGRRSKRSGRKHTAKKSIQRIAEERANKKYPNLEVLNSYYVAEDGQHKWYEVIMVDPNHPAIQNDDDINWVCESSNKRRAVRGKTSAGKKGRELDKK
ncbi:MAG: 50S ribosomal protein L15e [Candidatus Aenigmatarchaeota archaeon]